MAYPSLRPGRVLRAAELRAMQLHSVEQGVELVLNNTNSFTDTTIVIDVEAGAQYLYWLLIGYTSYDTTNPPTNFVYAWRVTGGADSVQRWSWGLGADGSGGIDSWSAVNFRRPLTTADIALGSPGGDGSGGTIGTNSFYEQGVIYGGEFDGQAIFQFRPASAVSADMSITGSSRVEYIRIA